jgi:hypothetical protein
MAEMAIDLGSLSRLLTLQNFVALCEIVYYSMPFRLICVIVFVLTTIWVIAKVYSGELQNAEKGPVAIRRHKGATTNANLDTIVVHRDLIGLTMDGVRAQCTFVYVFEGAKHKLVHVPLLKRSIQLSVSAVTLSDKVQGIVRANEISDVRTEEVYWPALDPDNENPISGAATPEMARDYAAQNKVLARWNGDLSLQLISVHQDLLEEVNEARNDYIEERVRKLREHKNGNWLQKLLTREAAKNRPGAIGNYYLKFQFSNDPIFVLRKHPDRDVRMTAWLTVLTSAFAIVLELFPLRVAPPAEARLTSAAATAASHRLEAARQQRR